MCDDEDGVAGESGEAYKIIQFFIEGVLTAALGIFGILGNIVSIKVGYKLTQQVREEILLL